MMPRVSAIAALSLALVQPAVAGEWTGGYAGLSAGYSYGEGAGATEDETGTVGGHVGYDYDFGKYVLGGELEYDPGALTLGAGTVDGVARLKMRAGYDFGLSLGYVVAGVGRAEGSAGDDTGAVYGIGAAYQVNDRLSLSAEVLRSRFDDLNAPGDDVDTNTINMRASFRF